MQALASGQVTTLDLAPDGRPLRPLVAVDVGAGASSETLERAAAVAASALPLVVGVADVVDRSNAALVEALTFTYCRNVAGSADATRCVVDPDPHTAVARLAEAVRSSPRASVVVGHVLRQTSQLPVRDALAAEAAAYSMLLGGPEFGRWLAHRGAARPPTTPDASPVHVVRSADALSVTLARPHRRNAFNAAMREALVEALEVAVADEAVVVELAGDGPDFCSGGDLDEFGTATDIGAAYLVRLERNPGWLLHRLRDRARVSVHGACIGAGVELAAFAGRVVASESSFFVLPEVSMGLIPGAGGTVSITRRIGRWRAAWLALTGERLQVDTAREWGLVDEVER